MEKDHRRVIEMRASGNPADLAHPILCTIFAYFCYVKKPTQNAEETALPPKESVVSSRKIRGAYADSSTRFVDLEANVKQKIEKETIRARDRSMAASPKEEICSCSSEVPSSDCSNDSRFDGDISLSEESSRSTSVIMPSEPSEFSSGFGSSEILSLDNELESELSNSREGSSLDQDEESYFDEYYEDSGASNSSHMYDVLDSGVFSLRNSDSGRDSFQSDDGGEASDGSFVTQFAYSTV